MAEYLQALFNIRETAIKAYTEASSQLREDTYAFEKALTKKLHAAAETKDMAQLAPLLFPLDAHADEFEDLTKLRDLFADAWSHCTSFPDCVDPASIHIDRRSGCVRFSITTSDFTQQEILPFLTALTENQHRSLTVNHTLAADEFNSGGRFDEPYWTREAEGSGLSPIAFWARALQNNWGIDSPLAEGIRLRDEIRERVARLNDVSTRALPVGLDELAANLRRVADRPERRQSTSTYVR